MFLCTVHSSVLHSYRQMYRAHVRSAGARVDQVGTGLDIMHRTLAGSACRRMQDQTLNKRLRDMFDSKVILMLDKFNQKLSLRCTAAERRLERVVQRIE
jgi:hypothetical protein